MRELKFRAWDIEEKCWIPPEQIAITADGNIISYDEQEDAFIDETIPIKICWYTGLRDKNGREIYEGDIVIQYYNEHDREVVKYDVDRAGYFPFASGDGCGCCEIYTWSPLNCVVIGNIYQNPELVEGGAE